MRNVLVTILGRDRPGIIYKVSRVLADFKLNIIEASQTTLLGEFAGLFSCALPKGINLAELDQALTRELDDSGLAHVVREIAPNETPPLSLITHEPYVVTVRGLDRRGLIPEFAGVLSGFDINIDALRAVSLPQSLEQSEKKVVMFFELSVPKDVNQSALRQALGLAADELDMEMSLQHRDIFEAIHRL
jgi:glycine cleavage system transcriptional repressor